MERHSISVDDKCPFCTDSIDNPWKEFVAKYDVDLVCISLKDRQDRALQAEQEFHRVGLCRFVTMVRPERGPTFWEGCWNSHHSVSEQASKQLLTVFEDDVCFDTTQTPTELTARVSDALENLRDADWYILYWGGVSPWSMPYRNGVNRSSTLTTHAYMLSPRGIQWMRDSPFGISSTRNHIDQYISQSMPGAYSLTPMIAYQRPLGTDNVKLQETLVLNPRGMRVLEIIIPITYLILGLLLAFACAWICYRFHNKHTYWTYVGVTIGFLLIAISIIQICIYYQVF